MLLLPVSGDLTGEARLEAVLRWWQAHGLHRDVLLRTPPKCGLQLQQGCSQSLKRITALTAFHTQASEDLIVPMSFLKFPSLLSNPSWTMISSTLNVCSVAGLLSFSAFFPKMTEKRCFFRWELKQKFTNSTGCSAPAATAAGDFTSYPSGKQWAAVRTQQDAIRLPPQRKTFSLDLVRQNMAAIHGWDSTVTTPPPTIFICFLPERWPHVDAAAGGENKFNTADV